MPRRVKSAPGSPCLCPRVLPPGARVKVGVMTTRECYTNETKSTTRPSAGFCYSFSSEVLQRNSHTRRLVWRGCTAFVVMPVIQLIRHFLLTDFCDCDRRGGKLSSKCLLALTECGTVTPSICQGPYLPGMANTFDTGRTADIRR